MTRTISIMWYATDSTGAIMQRQSDGTWITLEYLPLAIAATEVERRNRHLRAVYADNGIVVRED